MSRITKAIAIEKAHATEDLGYGRLKLIHESGKTETFFYCEDCEHQQWDVYMVHYHIWRQVMDRDRGILCIPCLETRLGRELTPNDLTNAQCNMWAKVWYFRGQKAQYTAMKPLCM